MALYRRFEFTILNAAGEPVSGASVEVRKQGATANASGSLSSISVHHVGAIIAGDTVDIDLGTAGVAVNSVAGPTAPTVVLASAKTVTNDVSRLTVLSPLPTVYNDVDGTEAKANPLTTDSNGFAFCYAPYEFVDAAVAVTAGGSAPNGPATPILRFDQSGVGGTFRTSSIIDSNAADAAFVDDTIRALVNANSKIRSFRVAGVEKAFISGAGDFSGVKVTASGLISGSAGLSITAGASTFAATVGFSAGVSSPGLTVNGVVDGVNGIVITNGGLKLADTTANIIMPNTTALNGGVFFRRLQSAYGTAVVAGDWSGTGLGGAGLVFAPLAGSRDMVGRVTVTLGAAPSANPTITLTFHDGSWGGGFAPIPIAFGVRTNGTLLHIPALASAISNTAITWTLIWPAPVAADSLQFDYMVLGRG